jgi:hypothetical protein
MVVNANRVAALGTFIAGLCGVVTSAAGVWPTTTTQNIALLAGAVGTIAGPLAHIIGSWIWDKSPAGQAPALKAVNETPALTPGPVYPPDE